MDRASCHEMKGQSAGNRRSGVTQCWRREGRKWRGVSLAFCLCKHSHGSWSRKQVLLTRKIHYGMTWLTAVPGRSSQQQEWIHMVTESLSYSWQLPLKSGENKVPQKHTGGSRCQDSWEDEKRRKILRKDLLGQCSLPLLFCLFPGNQVQTSYPNLWICRRRSSVC